MGSTDSTFYGFLDESDHAYLAEKGESDGLVVDPDVEERICEKAGAAIKELGLVFDYLDVSTLDSYFSDTADEAEFKEGIEGAFALGYWALLRSRTDPISILENAIELAETVNLPMSEGIDVMVSCRIQKDVQQIEVSELLDNVRTEDPLELFEDLATLGLVRTSRDDNEDNAMYMTLTSDFPGTTEDLTDVLDMESPFETDAENEVTMERVSETEIKLTTVD